MSPRRAIRPALMTAALAFAACGPALGPLRLHLEDGDHAAAATLAAGDRRAEEALATLLLERAAAADEGHSAAGLVRDLAGARAGRDALRRLADGDHRPTAELARIALRRRPGARTLDGWIDHDHAAVRAAAVARFGRRLDRGRLIDLLLDHDPDVRLAAVRALGRRSPGRHGRRGGAPRALGETLARDPELLVRAAAARAGQALGDGALERLRPALGDRELRVRRAALWGLGELGGEEAVSLIEDRAAGPLSPLATAALAELSRRGVAPGPGRFAEALEHRCPKVRATALAYMERAGFDAERRRAALIRALDDDSPELVLAAAERLVAGSDRPEEDLLAALGRIRDEGRNAAPAARDLLAHLGEDKALEDLEALLVVDGHEQEILAALPRLRGVKTLRPRFVGLLGDPREPVRLAAARAVLAAS